MWDKAGVGRTWAAFSSPKSGRIVHALPSPLPCLLPVLCPQVNALSKVRALPMRGPNWVRLSVD